MSNKRKHSAISRQPSAVSFKPLDAGQAQSFSFLRNGRSTPSRVREKRAREQESHNRYPSQWAAEKRDLTPACRFHSQADSHPARLSINTKIPDRAGEIGKQHSTYPFFADRAS